MKKYSARHAAAALLLLATASQQAVAHHSFAGQSDVEKPITLTGTVTKLEWTNPHAFFAIDVKGDNGAVGTWELELGSPNMLIRYKFTRDTIKIGDNVTVEGFLARDGSNLANAKTIRFADGRTFEAGSSVDLGDTR
jgi:DNA/RNA endonuclease YhcR with UshA esterase domain